MENIVVFHHAQGLTDGVLAFAGALREAGHVVYTPDLYMSETFADIESGVAHAEALGLDVVIERGLAAVADLPPDLVYVGFSLGVLPAQQLAQTRPGARGALLCHAAVPTSVFGASWPEGVPVQIHLMADDRWAEEDADAARALEEEADDAELFLYPGSAHLFADSSLDDYDPIAAGLLLERTLAFLSRLD
jgi:dienelactone hydrolase